MKILVTGSTGLLGQALSRELARSSDVTGLSRYAPAEPGAVRHITCDLLDARRTAQVIRAVRPEAVVHAQAQSDVDRCELEPAMARAQNVETVAHLIEGLGSTGGWLVSVSTDYVFDGTKGRPYDETDAPNPVNVYGRCKVAGEQLVLGFPRGIVVRTSTLFGASRMNFCDHVVMRLRQGQVVEAFSDQTTSPTYTDDVAEAIAALLTSLGRVPQLPIRILHMANAGGCSRVEFAQRIADLLDYPRTHIQAIQMVDQHRPAPRPAYSALTTRYLSEVIGRTLRPWDDALQAYLRQRHPTTRAGLPKAGREANE